VAEDRQGRYWAIQAKAYAKTYAVTKADVDTFLSESSRKVFFVRLLVATTNRVGARAYRTLHEQEKAVHLLRLADLEGADVSWPSDPADLVGSKVSPVRPRPHQRRAVTDVVSGFRQHRRGQLIMACGTGKTLVGLWVAERLGADRILVLLPSLSLLSQTLRVWKTNAARPFHHLLVCSDETVESDDEPSTRTVDLPAPVTTDASEISSFLRGSGRRVVFSTYHSSPQIAAAFQSGRTIPPFGLAIADEAHRCAGPGDAPFATILREDAIRSRRRLFMTATPRYATRTLRRQAEDLDMIVASMDDQTMFGPVLHRLPFSTAIKRRLLSDYQVAVVPVNYEDMLDFTRRGTLVQLPDGAVQDARTLGAQIGLARAMRRYDLRRVISFHNRVRSACAFARSFPDVVPFLPPGDRPTGTLHSDFVSGVHPAGQRSVLLDQFKDAGATGRALLANARCLTEGVDVPSIDGVAFVDPRRSEVDVVQAVGRAIRRSPNKKIGTIVLPVFVGPQEHAVDSVETSMFKHVWQVILALRSHDEALAESLDELRRELGRQHTSIRLPQRIKLLAPTRLRHDFAQAFDIALVEYTTSTWDFKFGLLQKFVEQTGHARVPKHLIENNGHKLGQWVGFQRQLKKDGQLHPKRAALLESLPGWLWAPHRDRWEENYDDLKEFVVKHGHARVATAYTTPAGSKLGVWADSQREKKRSGELSADREDRLACLPKWSWHPSSDKWQEGFVHLKAFAARAGHCRIPTAYRTADRFPLGKWVAIKRMIFRRGGIEALRRAALQRLPGWTWNASADRWDLGFQHLQEYVKQTGNANVPADFVTRDGLKLGDWVERARTRKSQLSSARVIRLESLAGWTWNARVGRWAAMLASLGEYVRHQHHAKVPALYRTSDGKPLGTWVVNVRKMFRENRLSEDRARQLKAVRGWTWVSAARTGAYGGAC
jgi:superfamily II DNA or RNA helicase